MPTIVTSTIGTTGRDYSTLQAWEDAAPANLVTSDQVWRGECYNDSEFTGALTVSGSTVDATHYKELTCATGESFADDPGAATNPLRYDQSKGVGLHVTSSYTDVFTITENYFRMSRMQAKRSTGGGGSRVWLDSGASDTQLSQCIFENDRSAAVALVYTNTLVSACLFISRVSSAPAIVTVSSSGGVMVNCTLVVPSDLTAATAGVTRSYASSWTIKNCAIFGVSNTGDTTGITYTNCYSDDASPPTGVTTLAYDTSTGSGFENITDATRDFRLKSTSALIGAGTSSGAPVSDIIGVLFGSPPSVGAWEVAAAVTLEQEGFRFGNDDGAENAHTWAAAQDTDLTAPAGQTQLINLIINATGDPATKVFKLQHRKVGDPTWKDTPVI